MFLKNPSIRDRREKWMLFFVWSQSVWPSVTFPVRLRNPRCPCGIVFFLTLARIHFLFLRALLALDVAAPAHLALARPGQHAALCVMATPTADGVAVLVLVALPCWRPCRVHAGLAEVGRVLDVQQVRGAWERLGSGARWRVGQLALTFRLVGGAGHLECGLVALLQHHADFVKWRQLTPTRLHRAGAWHAVALTGRIHASLNDLCRKRGKYFKIRIVYC